jgi:diguanylate cyclase (GGDEF)-like protein/PAS domain S-box-containing protein
VSDKELVRVLTIFDVPEQAEQLVNIIRNDGQIVRDIRAEDDEDMLSAINENPIDIILCKNKLAYFSSTDALDVIHQSGRDIPLVVISDSTDDSSFTEALKKGARDIASLEEPERLLHIIKREIGDLKNRKQLRRSEQMLHEAEKRARALIDTSRDSIAYVHDGMHIYANKAYLEMFGYESQDDVEGIPILDMVSAENHAKLKNFLRNYAKGQTEDDTLEVEAKHINGTAFNMSMEFTPASMEGEACTQIIIRAKADSKELEEQLNVLSKQDLLTGLYNRTYFLEQVDKLVSQAVVGKVTGAMLIIEIDKFEDIRHDVGIADADKVLVDIAKILKGKLEQYGVLARLEGPSFTFLLTDVNINQAEEFASGILKLLKQSTSTVKDKVITLTASIGITHINETIHNLQECISRTEKGCAIAKKEGGNQYSIFNPSFDDLEEKQQVSHWSHQIKEALRQNHFRLLYQPIVSLHGVSGAHYEVLVRMLDESGQVLPPREFISAADQAGLTKFIDRWVIANTFKILSERTKEGLETRFFIKVSSGSITDAEFIPWIRERLKTLKLDTTNLIFEFDESTALNHLAQAKTVVDQFRALNCRTAIENFGTEQNTYLSMDELNVDFVKIHSNLINNLAQSVENQEKVKEIASHAREKGMQSIAAFVEDANSLAVLWQCGVDFIQGHFLQQPETELSYEFEGAF